MEASKRVFQTAFLIQLCLAILVFILEYIGLRYINNKMVLPECRVPAANWIFQFSVCSLILVIFQNSNSPGGMFWTLLLG